jgi:hypothetical protein
MVQVSWLLVEMCLPPRLRLMAEEGQPCEAGHRGFPDLASSKSGADCQEH